MSYLTDVKRYSAYLPTHMQKEFLLQVRKLVKDGVSYEWIYRALTNKDVEDWCRYGFGLLWKKEYRAQITKLIETEKRQIDGIDVDSLSWETLFEEEGEEMPQEDVDTISLSDELVRYTNVSKRASDYEFELLMVRRKMFCSNCAHCVTYDFTSENAHHWDCGRTKSQSCNSVTGEEKPIVYKSCETTIGSVHCKWKKKKED